MAVRFITSGESHGKALTGILEGVPSGLSISVSEINNDLRRRQLGYGRGGRMKIESDRAEILSGIRFGKTLGSPIAILIENKDWINWKETMSPEAEDRSSELKTVTRPRPGHADLPGAIKYDTHDIRDILERSSARETAMRVALGAIAREFLSEFNVKIGSYVVQIGKIQISNSSPQASRRGDKFLASDESPRRQVSSLEKELLKIFERAEKSPLRCPDKTASQRMILLIDNAIKEGNSLGGIFEIFVTGLPPGIGSHIQWDKRLDGMLAQAIMSIQAIKGVEIGLGFEMGRRYGSDVMDEIFCKSSKFYRKTNNAGGIEGGMTNGMPIIIRAAMKPIPTLRKPLTSVDIITKKPFKAAYERSDVCAVPAAGVVGEAMAALIIADAFVEKFGGDSMAEIKRNYNSYIRYISKF
ncbi:MAG: chorismate synthase [Nitrospirae bacterium]|nr:chorismate synthase [Nitrospirota bacterium]